MYNGRWWLSLPTHPGGWFYDNSRPCANVVYKRDVAAQGPGANYTLPDGPFG